MCVHVNSAWNDQMYWPKKSLAFYTYATVYATFQELGLEQTWTQIAESLDLLFDSLSSRRFLYSRGLQERAKLKKPKILIRSS